MSMRLHVIFSVTCSLAVGSGLAAQTTDAPRRPRLEGKWQAKAEDEIRHIMVRSDSSAQFGDQVARWRGGGGSLWLALGGGDRKSTRPKSSHRPISYAGLCFKKK